MSVHSQDAPAGANAATTKIRELLEQYRLPGVDLDGFIAARQSDIEAISKATAAAFAGAQTITEKQADLWKAALDELKDALTPPAAGADKGTAFEDAVRKQSELVQSALGRTLDSMKEMAEAAQRAQIEVFNLAVERVHGNAEELRTLFTTQNTHKK
ncbi:MAG: TIGR01841 family phasin [Vulcanimicrobiaceae bacterium]